MPRCRPPAAAAARQSDTWPQVTLWVVVTICIHHRPLSRTHIFGGISQPVLAHTCSRHARSVQCAPVTPSHAALPTGGSTPPPPHHAPLPTGSDASPFLTCTQRHPGETLRHSESPQQRPNPCAPVASLPGQGASRHQDGTKLQCLGCDSHMPATEPHARGSDTAQPHTHKCQDRAGHNCSGALLAGGGPWIPQGQPCKLLMCGCAWRSNHCSCMP